MTPDQRIYQGNRAREVLENEAFVAAFDDIEKELIEQWQNSPARDAEGRERIWTYLMLLRKVKTHLTQTMESGKLVEIDTHYRKTMAQKVREWTGIDSLM